MFFEPIYIPRALNTGTCLWQGDQFLSCGPTQEPCVSHSQHSINRERFCKNAGEWTGRIEINEEEISDSKHVWLYTDLLQALKGERISSVFSPDETLISASAAPDCGAEKSVECSMFSLTLRCSLFSP